MPTAMPTATTCGDEFPLAAPWHLIHLSGCHGHRQVKRTPLRFGSTRTRWPKVSKVDSNWNAVGVRTSIQRRCDS